MQSVVISQILTLASLHSPNEAVRLLSLCPMPVPSPDPRQCRNADCFSGEGGGFVSRQPTRLLPVLFYFSKFSAQPVSSFIRQIVVRIDARADCTLFCRFRRVSKLLGLLDCL
mmetsp:Transcript_42490/g.83767  ORF Transcript_42490/g.83767 Transcript_42490/m.83767 type:complete len:113 (+) Transcript_42490:974-1312(+)